MRNSVAILFLCLIVSASFADDTNTTIKLKDGSEISGRIVEETSGHIIIESDLGVWKIDKAQIVAEYATVYTIQGSKFQGEILRRNEKEIVLHTEALGEVTLSTDRIDRIVIGQTSQSPPDAGKQDEPGIGKAFLYESRRKKVGTAMGLQAFGAGLLYAEKYALGSTMLLAENGLIVGGMFVEGDGQVAMTISGILLKAVNTFLSIHAVNSYNERLRRDMGLVEPSSVLRPKRNYYAFTPSAGVGIAVPSEFNYTEHGTEVKKKIEGILGGGLSFSLDRTNSDRSYFLDTELYLFKGDESRYHPDEGRYEDKDDNDWFGGVLYATPGVGFPLRKGTQSTVLGTIGLGFSYVGLQGDAVGTHALLGVHLRSSKADLRFDYRYNHVFGDERPNLKGLFALSLGYNLRF